MKKLLLIILTGLCFTSCTKQLEVAGAANQNMFFQDAGVAVKNFNAVPTATGIITIDFATIFENNISRIELMSSNNASTFCTVQFIEVKGNSGMEKSYTLNDANAKGNTMYYMLRFKDNSGSWTYSPYLTVHVHN
jgi:hypothetical protein